MKVCTVWYIYILTGEAYIFPNLIIKCKFIELYFRSFNRSTNVVLETQFWVNKISYFFCHQNIFVLFPKQWNHRFISYKRVGSYFLQFQKKRFKFSNLLFCNIVDIQENFFSRLIRDEILCTKQDCIYFYSMFFMIIIGFRTDLFHWNTRVFFYWEVKYWSQNCWSLFLIKS
jgi:hypothetical protein